MRPSSFITKFCVIYSYCLPQETDSLCQHFLLILRDHLLLESYPHLLSLCQSKRYSCYFAYAFSERETWEVRENLGSIPCAFRRRFHMPSCGPKWWGLLGPGRGLRKRAVLSEAFFFPKGISFTMGYFSVVCNLIFTMFCMFKSYADILYV